MNSPSIYPTGSLIANRYKVVQGPAEKHSLLGGMGLVYLCIDRQEDRPVALKTFKPEYLPDREARDRFLREGTTWVNLGEHPHIVHAYGVERIGDGREVFLVLEQIAKEQRRQDASLRAWLTGQPLPIEHALLIALQIVRGLQHAAEKVPGFVHRDLKPENILVGADRLPGWPVNRVRVTDFGLAAVLSSINPVTLRASEQSEIQDQQSKFSRTQLTDGLVGTPLYMAPEQWRGESTSVVTDVYALGLILFEMLTGQQAVTGRTRAELERTHCEGRLTTWPWQVPGDVQDLVNQCLQTTPAARYGTWEAVAQAVAAVCKALTGQVAPPPEPAQELARNERVALGWAQSTLGQSYLDLGKAEVARDYFERARAVGQQEGERRLEGAALGNLGNAYAALGDARQALGYHEQCLEIHRTNGDRDGEGSALGNLGNACRALGDARRAIRYHEQSLEIARASGDRQVEGAALGNLGNAYADLGEVQQALRYYEKYLALARKSGDQRGEGTALGNLGNACRVLGDVRRALGYFEQALALARANGDRQGEGNALGNLGFAYKDLGEVRKALGYFKQCLEIHREIGNRQGEGNALNGLGNAHFQFGEARQAIGYYEQALAIRRELGDRHGEGADLCNLGSAYADLGEERHAIEYFEQAIGISREIGDINTVASISFNTAILYFDQNDLAHALPLAQEAERLWAQIGSPNTQRAQQLVAQLQGGASPTSHSPPPAAQNPSLAAFEAFQRATSSGDMRQAAAQYPFMTGSQFVATIEQFIRTQVPPQLQPASQQRLTWLRKLAGLSKPGFLGRLFGKKE